MDMQTTKPQEEEVFFKERADTFQLNVTLRGDERLTIALKDFVDWIIYSKEYTQEDYCKEIHKKMELIDVFAAFAQTRSQCDEKESMKGNETHVDKLKKYQFGTVVEDENKNLPCYKIERGGKIIVYTHILDRRTNKQAIYESKLILNKARNMTETEISTERSTMEKNLIFDELTKEIEKERKEKAELLKRIIKLEEENQKIKEEAVLIREELRATKQELVAKDAEVQQKINQAKRSLEANFNSAKAELMARNQQLHKRVQLSDQQLNETKQKLNETKQELTNSINSNRAESNNKINAAQQEFNRQNQRSLDKFGEIQQILKPIRDTIALMKLPQAYIGYFSVNGLVLNYIGPTGHTDYFFNAPINHNQTASFKIRVNMTKSRHIMVGVVDYAKQKDQRRSFDSGNALCYYGHNGNKYPQVVNEGDGFKQGDVMEVHVNRATSTIRYVVNGVHKATHTGQILGDNSRVLMPVANFHDTYDSIEWLL